MSYHIIWFKVTVYVLYFVSCLGDGYGDLDNNLTSIKKIYVYS